MTLDHALCKLLLFGAIALDHAASNLVPSIALKQTSETISYTQFH